MKNSLLLLATATVFILTACAAPIIKPNVPQMPVPNEDLPYEWFNPGPEVLPILNAVNKNSVGNAIRIKVIEPSLGLYRCDMPDQSNETFDPRHFGLFVEIENGTSAIWSANDEQSEVLFEIGGRAVPILINPARNIVSVFLGLKGGDAILNEIGAWGKIFNELKSVRTNELEASKEEKPLIPPSAGGLLSVLGDTAGKIFGNPAILLMDRLISKRFEKYQYRTAASGAEKAKFEYQVGGIYTINWTTYKKDRIERELYFEVSDEPTNLIKKVQQTYDAYTLEQHRAGADQTERLRNECSAKISSALRAYSEWPVRILPGYTSRVYLPFSGSELMGLDKTPEITFFGAPVAYSADGTIAKRDTIRIPLRVTESKLGELIEAPEPASEETIPESKKSEVAPQPVPATATSPVGVTAPAEYASPLSAAVDVTETTGSEGQE